MVRVKTNPFRLDHQGRGGGGGGEGEYHSLLLSDDLSGSGRRAKNSSGSGGTPSGRHVRFRSGTTSSSGGGSSNPSSMSCANYVAIFTVLLFFGILYSVGYQTDGEESISTSSYHPAGHAESNNHGGSNNQLTPEGSIGDGSAISLPSSLEEEKYQKKNQNGFEDTPLISFDVDEYDDYDDAFDASSSEEEEEEDDYDEVDEYEDYDDDDVESVDTKNDDDDDGSSNNGHGIAEPEEESSMSDSSSSHDATSVDGDDDDVSYDIAADNADFPNDDDADTYEDDEEESEQDSGDYNPRVHSSDDGDDHDEEKEEDDGSGSQDSPDDEDSSPFVDTEGVDDNHSSEGETNEDGSDPSNGKDDATGGGTTSAAVQQKAGDGDTEISDGNSNDETKDSSDGEIGTDKETSVQKEGGEKETFGAASLPNSGEKPDDIAGSEGSEPESSNVSDEAAAAAAAAQDEERGQSRFKKDPRVVSGKYLPRGKPIDDAAKETLASKWGSWTFVDPRSDKRPKADFYADYPNRDVPRSKFPKNAWQLDHEYLSEFLPQASALVRRAMEAILSEYGKGETDEPDLSFDERSKMFQVVFSDDLKENDFGGTTNQKSFDGLVRRVLHSIMAEDTFVFVMGGHSAAAGHGNHFQQSYTLQFQRAMEPIFARLGVKCTARNVGMGGLGTSQNALAAGSIYGEDIDFLMWDSGMTEREDHVIDMFMRQGLVGGKKVPFLMGGKADILKRLHQYADADVGMPGSGMSGVPKTSDLKQVKDLPWATQYLDCDKELYSECRGHAYNGTCWIERSDFEPKTKQNSEPSGRAKWHPGNRVHQLKGRVLAFTVLRALEKGLSQWSEAENYELDDELWHVSEYFDNIRTKAMSSVPKQESKDCYDMNLPDRVCTLPIQGRTENTPRAYPAQTSIRSILKHQNQVYRPFKNVYDPPDVRNPALDVPDGEIDYLSIVENGNDFIPLNARKRGEVSYSARSLSKGQKGDAIKISPGKGWNLDSISAPDNCDGSYDSFCGRSFDNDCLLYGHNDYRGGLVFDGLSGWLVMNLEDFKHGIIMIKVEDWHQSGENKKTEGWTCENNNCVNGDNADDNTHQMRRWRWRKLGSAAEGGQRLLRGGGGGGGGVGELDANRNDAVDHSTIRQQRERPRELKPAVPEYCDDFQFQFAVDGKVTTWNLQQWQERMVQLQRVVQLWTLMDDESGGEPAGESESRTVELAIRATGCGRNKTFYLTHVYWA